MVTSDDWSVGSKEREKEDCYADLPPLVLIASTEQDNELVEKIEEEQKVGTELLSERQTTRGRRKSEERLVQEFGVNQGRVDYLGDYSRRRTKSVGRE